MKMPFKLLRSVLWTTSALLFALFSSIVPGAPQKASGPIIAVSSDLELAMPQIVNLFVRSGGGSVQIVYDSPEKIYQRIKNGERIQLVLAGEEDVANRLAKEGKTTDPGVLYAVGRLALYAPHMSPLYKDDNGTLGAFQIALKKKALTSVIAIDPDASAYGKELADFLRSQEVWDTVQPILKMAPSAAAAAKNAIADKKIQGAFIAYAHARHLVEERGGRAQLLSYDILPPIPQRMVLMKDAEKRAQLFYSFMQSKRVKRLLLDYGFLLPSGETEAMLAE